jgi:predicted kinase
VYDEMIKWVNAAVNQYRKVVVDARFYKKDLRTRFVEEVKTKTALLLLKL